MKKTVSIPIVLLILISIIVIFLYTKKENELRNDSTGWLTTEATIVSSQLRRKWDKNSGSPTTRYWFEIGYTYEVNDQIYTGSRFQFHGDPVFRNKARAEKLLADYPPGKKILITYQPDSPQESVVLR